MENRKTVALVAHDNKKPDLLDWVREHMDLMVNYRLYATGTTGAFLMDGTKDIGSLEIRKLLSGPLGGDQQIGAKIAEARLISWSSFGIPWNPNLTTRT